MAKQARTWTPLDTTVAQHFARLRLTTTPTPTYRSLGTALDVSHTRVQQLLDCQGAPPTLSEFTALCHYFHLPTGPTLQHLEQQADSPTARLTDEQRRAIILDRLSKDRYTLAAHTDPYKHETRTSPSSKA